MLPILIHHLYYNPLSNINRFFLPIKIQDAPIFYPPLHRHPRPYGRSCESSAAPSRPSSSPTPHVPRQIIGSKAKPYLRALAPLGSQRSCTMPRRRRRRRRGRRKMSREYRVLALLEPQSSIRSDAFQPRYIYLVLLRTAEDKPLTALHKIRIEDRFNTLNHTDLMFQSSPSVESLHIRG